MKKNGRPLHLHRPSAFLFAGGQQQVNAGDIKRGAFRQRYIFVFLVTESEALGNTPCGTHDVTDTTVVHIAALHIAHAVERGKIIYACGEIGAGGIFSGRKLYILCDILFSGHQGGRVGVGAG